jgi:hypothetical protein
MVRIPVPGRARVGETLAAAVRLDDLLLFDRAGRRIRFFAE